MHLPSGWDDRTRAYGGGMEEQLNTHPPHVPLRALAGRMIRLGNERVINFVLLRPPTAVRVDRAPAVIWDYAGSPPFGAVKVRAALIRHSNTFHLVSLTATPYGFQAGSARLAEILASWRWERARPTERPRIRPA